MRRRRRDWRQARPTFSRSAIERIRSLIDTVVLKPENGVLAIYLRGEFASMLELCVCPETQKASADVTEEALQIKMVAGTGFEPVTFRL